MLIRQLAEEEEVRRLSPYAMLSAKIITDFIAGLSDREALLLYEEVFLPKPWIEGR